MILKLLAILLVLPIAIILGWLSRQMIPEGVLFATIIPLAKGKLPYVVFGDKMIGECSVPAIPSDAKPSPRPEGESFLVLRGTDDLIPQQGIGMCCRPSAYDPESVRRTTLWYLLKGGRHIDTADLYLNHRPIGEAMKIAIQEYNIPRSEMFLTTKLTPRFYGYESTLKSIQRYLEELGVEYLDLVLMHAPSANFPGIPQPECSSKSFSDSACRADTWKGLSEARKNGWVRNVGVSNFNVKQMKELVALETKKDGVVAAAPVAVNQFQFNPFLPEDHHKIFEFCQQNGIVVTAWSSLAGTTFQQDRAMSEELLHKIAASKKIAASGKNKPTTAQILLRWAIQKNATIIPGTGNPKHMQENLDVYNFKLTDTEMEQITALRHGESAKKFVAMPL